MRRLSIPLDAKYTASATPIVSTSPRVVVSTLWISPAIGAATSCGQVSSSSLATSSASSLEPRNEAASEVTTIRNGNNAISADSAIWLAIAHPSSARNRLIASMKTRNNRRRLFTGRSGSRGGQRLRSWIITAIARGARFAARGKGASCSLHVREEAAHLAVEAFGLDRQGIGQCLNIGSSGTGVSGSAGDAAHCFRAAARLG